MRIGILVIVAAIAGCGQPEDGSSNIHDSKYRLANDAATAGGGCVLDTVTGLTWEIKNPDSGLRAARNTYSWYNPEQSSDELDYRGTPDAGQCDSSECDTWHFVIAVNQSGLCGFDDWRVPSRDELLSISDRRRSAPTINTQFFPHAQAAEYWTSNDYSFQPDSAWAWSFEFGHDRVDWKKSPKFVRLVRGESRDLMPVKE